MPEPERIKGWEEGEVVWKRRRSMLRDSPKVVQKEAPTWDSLAATVLVSYGTQREERERVHSRVVAHGAQDYIVELNWPWY